MKDWSEGKKECYHDFIEQMIKDGYVKKPRKKAEPKDDYWPEKFKVMYEDYPRKAGPEAARKAWNKLKPSLQLADEMYNHYTKAYVETEKQFIPNFSSYLNGQKWKDEIIKVKPKLLTLPMDDNELDKTVRENKLPQANLGEAMGAYKQRLKQYIIDNSILQP